MTKIIICSIVLTNNYLKNMGAARKKDVLNLEVMKVAIKNEVDKRIRYSEDELLEFKELILGKLEIARGELKYLQDQLGNKGDMGDHSDSRPKGLDDGTSTSEREYLSQMAGRQKAYIDHLGLALYRIEAKTYGVCRETGKLIPPDRLRAVSHATLCIEAKQGRLSS